MNLIVKNSFREYLESLEKYATNGFLAVQTMVDNIILRRETEDTEAELNVDVSSMIIPAHIKDDLILTLRGTGQSLLSLPILLPYLRMVNGIMREKEKRIKEGMKIMGLKNSAFYLSWLITYLIIFTVTSFLVTSILKATFLKASQWIFLFLWHWEFCMATMAMGLFATVFFSKAKVGNVFAFVLCFLFGWLEQISAAEDASSAKKFFTGLGPATSISLAATQILNLEGAELGLTGDTVDMKIFNYKVTYHYITMAIDIVVFLLLAAYLDQVLPSEFGISKHPLFCLMRKKKSRYHIIENETEPAAEVNSANFEETDPSLKSQDKNNESIIIKALRKMYSNGKLAVDDVSYNMYQGQIFALLGHNGAGKTSTINMITGLYPATSGTVSVFGQDIHDQLEEIRKILGVCPQHDVLFDNLTVEEHLKLFATFKGMDPKLIPAEIEKIINDLDLNEKKDYLTKHLSGGQKRKLSIGIAFIGGSKFILLDEPSSGMDTSARRRLWDMLKNYKHGRVVLLTTHYMDEADYLGDRIAIMGEGKIQCLGRPLFLKNRFGVGYSLTLVKNDINDPSQPIIDFIQKRIPEGKVTSNVSAEVSIQLPLETVSKFKDLFDQLDQSLKDLRVSNYGVSVTTLEEVFLNVSKIVVPNSKNNKVEASEKNKKNDDDMDNFDLVKERVQSNWQLFGQHFVALMIKRYHYFKRDKKGLLLELFLPVLMIIIGIAITKTDVIKEPVPLKITNRFYDHVNHVAINTRLPYGSPVDPEFLNDFDQDDFIFDEKDTRELTTFDNMVFEDRGSEEPFSKFSLFVKDLDTTTNDYRYQVLIDTRAQDAAAFALNKVNQAVIRYATGNNDLQITTYISPFALTQGSSSIENLIDGLSISFIFSIGMSFIPASVVTFIVKERELNVKHQQIVSGVSISAYWLSNYLVDILKYLVPGILSSLIALAMDAEGLIQGEKYGVLWMLFILYGFSITSFVYLTSFLFKDYGTAQMATFFGNFGSGFIGGLAIAILRLIKSTNSLAHVLHWFFRFIPTFSLTYGFLNLSNNEIYAAVEEYYIVKSPWDIDIAGGDVLFLGMTAVIYFLMLFILEALRSKKSVNDLFAKPVPYERKEMDGDVETEMEIIKKANLKDYSIAIRELRKVFYLRKKQHKVAVDKISFGIKNGECFALLGVNGAGKTTTFKMLTGEIIPTEGEIFINGYAVPQQLGEARRFIGYCPQFDALLENLTAREHLELYATIKGIPKNKRAALVDKQLRELNLKQFENIPAGTYSGGNKRKLSVAIAMIGNPPIVFLDEPSNGMDPEARRFMWNVISRISTERKQSSIILTTHSMEEAEALATKIGIQVDGNLKCLGSAQHIKNRYGGGYEIEIKMQLPTKQEVKAFLTSIGHSSGTELNKEQVHNLLSQVGLEKELLPQLKENGSGSVIYLQLNKNKVSVDLVVDWIIIEKNGFKLTESLQKYFTGLTLIEHFQSFYRFRINSDISIGKVFGMFEDHKTELNILQYSVKQGSIEQIFNAFANNALTVKARSENQNSNVIIDINKDKKSE